MNLPTGELLVTDFDGDTNADLVVLDPLEKQLIVALGDGMGGLTSTDSLTVDGSFNYSTILAGDFSGEDGLPELAIVQRTQAQIVLIDRTQSGAMSVGTTHSFEDFGTFSDAIATIDFDGDGWSDFVVGTSQPTSALRFLHNVGGTPELLDASVAIPGCAPTGLGVLGDEPLELIVSGGACGAAQDGLPAVHVAGEVLGELEILGMHPTGNDAVELAVGELDGVGEIDVAIANQRDVSLTILRHIDGSLVADASIALSDFCGDCVRLEDVEIGDLDGDMYGDIVVIVQRLVDGVNGTLALYVLEDALSTAPRWHWLSDDWTLPWPVLGDFNNDGRDDVVTHDYTSVGMLLSN